MAQEEKWRKRRVRVVGEFCYKPEKWKHLKWQEYERVICRVDFTDRGLEVRYVLVSDQYGVPQTIYEEQYCKRGLTEQYIGRFKQTGQQLSAQEFYANQFRLIMCGVAYMLLLHLREWVSGKLKRSDVNTLRKTLMVMPMVIRRTQNKLVLQISEHHAHCREHLGTWRRLSPA